MCHSSSGTQTSEKLSSSFLLLTDDESERPCGDDYDPLLNTLLANSIQISLLKLDDESNQDPTNNQVELPSATAAADEGRTSTPSSESMDPRLWYEDDEMLWANDRASPYLSDSNGGIEKFPATFGLYSELGVVLSLRATIHINYNLVISC